MCGREWERPMERQSDQISRDGAMANLMKPLSEAIVAVAMEPSGKEALREMKFPLRFQGEESSK